MADENTLAEAPGEEIVNLDQDANASTEEDAKPDETEAGKAEGAGDQAGDDANSEEEKPKKLSGSRRERLRNEQLRRENEELRAALERRPQAGESEDKEPQEADFNGDIFAYERAVNSYNTRKIIREETMLAEQRRQSTEHNEVWRETVVAHQERVETARESIPDYDKVLASAQMPVSQEVSRELIASDKSALLAYYLARNPEKLERLNGMTGTALAREIGRLEGSVRMPASNQKTNAPSPIQPLKGGAAPAFDPSHSSMDDYIAKRNSGWSG
ncbi:MAG: hypothetical protein J0G95_10845 [Rhizobiales bacterium]|nr:hypothetical protein [Hyphomicrobiales bacterium]